MSIFRPDDFYGRVIILQSTMAELLKELDVSTCEDSPFLTRLAVRGLAARVDELREAIEQAMVVHRKSNDK